MTDLPARIGPYRVTRKLGEGGMGVVYAGLSGFPKDIWLDAMT